MNGYPELKEPVDGPRANEFPSSPINYLQEDAPILKSRENYRSITIDIPAHHWTPDIEYIFDNFLPNALKLFAAKSADYARGSNITVDSGLGVPGQWLKLLGKVEKLKRPLWDERGEGSEFQFESVQEILNDLIGHVLLTKMHYERAREKVEGLNEQREDERETLRQLKEAALKAQEEARRERIQRNVDEAREKLSAALVEASREGAYADSKINLGEKVHH